MAMQVSEGLLSGAEVARLIGRTPGHVRKLGQWGRIEHVNTTLGRLYPREAVEKYRAEREAKASA